MSQNERDHQIFAHLYILVCFDFARSRCTSESQIRELLTLQYKKLEDEKRGCIQHSPFVQKIFERVYYRVRERQYNRDLQTSISLLPLSTNTQSLHWLIDILTRNKQTKQNKTKVLSYNSKESLRVDIITMIHGTKIAIDTQLSIHGGIFTGRKRFIEIIDIFHMSSTQPCDKMRSWKWRKDDWDQLLWCHFDKILWFTQKKDVNLC
jgi:hypothetical protein